MQLLQMRNFTIDSWDLKWKTNLKSRYDYIHICFPYSDTFIEDVKEWQRFGTVIVHSTVKPGTCKNIGCIYSPVRGVHIRMLSDLQRYTKYYSGDKNLDIEKRFKICKNVFDSTKLELTKILVDTTYYGWLIAYRKYVDSKYDVDWSFAEEINTVLNNRPIMYNDKKPIGGHCVIENLDLVNDDLFKKIIGQYGSK